MDHFKLMIKFLLSVSLISVLFSLLPLLFQSLEPFLSEFFNFTISKTHMFLLCNGLLVLVTASSSTTTTQHSSETPQIGMSQFKELDIAAPVYQENGVKAQHPEEEEESLIVVDLQKEDEAADMILEEDEEEESLVMKDLQRDDEIGHTEKVEEEEDEEAEELNKKCEDFIRRMKAGFCSEKSSKL